MSVKSKEKVAKRGFASCVKDIVFRTHDVNLWFKYLKEKEAILQNTIATLNKDSREYAANKVLLHAYEGMLMYTAVNFIHAVTEKPAMASGKDFGEEPR